MDDQVRASREAPRSNVSGPVSNDQKDRSGLKFELSLLSGKTQTYDSAHDLQEDVLRGVVSRSIKARTVAIDKHGKSKESKWSSVEQIAVANAELRSLYRPVWAYTMKYLWYGAVAGFVLKGLDTAVRIFAVDEAACIAWLVVLGSLLLVRKWLYAPLVAIIVSRMLGKGDLLSFLIGSILGAMVTGFIFGVPAGMITGTVVGHCRRGRCRLAPDAELEGFRPYLLGLVLPLVFLAIAVPLYMWLSMKMAQWPS